MNTVEKTSTGVTPAELILNNSKRLSNRILAPGSANPTSRVALSDTKDNWVARQYTLLQVAQAHQHQSDSHLLVEYDPRITEYPIHSYVLFTPPVGRSNKLLPKHRRPFQLMDKTDSIYIIEDLVSGKRITTHIHNLRPFIYDPIRTNPLTVAQHNIVLSYRQRIGADGIVDERAKVVDMCSIDSTMNSCSLMSKSSSLSRSLDIAATAIDDPPYNSTLDGLDSTSPATAGSRTRPSCMSTNSMITCASMP
jgi:hypothetical protein